MSGIGSLVTFQSLLPGVLETGARTIQSAIDVQKAASVAAATPMATGFIKNSGADLPEAQVSGILAAWKAARASRSTAYLTSTLDYQTVGFSPKDMLYTEAIVYLSISLDEGFNLPAMEARNLYDLPLVLSKANAHIEFHKNYAFFIDSPEELVEFDFFSLRKTEQVHFQIDSELKTELMKYIN